MPIGMPGWPELAASTESIANARMAFAMSLWLTIDIDFSATGMGVFLS
jgi:hypothetical protein